MKTNAQIAKSKKQNEYKLILMKERDACIEKVKERTLREMQAKLDPNDPKYRETMKNLIIQVSAKDIRGHSIFIGHD